MASEVTEAPEITEHAHPTSQPEHEEPTVSHTTLDADDVVVPPAAAGEVHLEPEQVQHSLHTDATSVIDTVTDASAHDSEQLPVSHHGPSLSYLCYAHSSACCLQCIMAYMYTGYISSHISFQFIISF
jgi:hypothetical protein